jgi:hypothetical protein
VKNKKRSEKPVDSSDTWTKRIWWNFFVTHNISAKEYHQHQDKITKRKWKNMREEKERGKKEGEEEEDRVKRE